MSTYTGDNYKDLDVSTPTEGSVGTIPEFNDAIRETKRVLKQQNAITTITGDTTLDKTYSTVKINKATAIAVTLPTPSTVASAAFIKEYYLQNIGAGIATINATVTLAGTATASPTMAQWDEMRIWTDGTTWYGVKYKPPFRGVLVKRITTPFALTSGVQTPIQFNGEEYDTDSCHDNSTNPERITVPIGVTKVKITYIFNCSGTGLSTPSYVSLTKTGSAYVGAFAPYNLSSTTQFYSLGPGGTTAINVTGGDYFTLDITMTGTNPVANTGCWLSMEIVE